MSFVSVEDLLKDVDRGACAKCACEHLEFTGMREGFRSVTFIFSCRHCGTRRKVRRNLNACPECSSSKVRVTSRQAGVRYMACRDCDHTFNVED